MDGLRVSELAERAGVAPSTVRFYERAGLLSPARRAANGYRVFDESALDELAFISRAKGIGMSLEDIADLVGPRSRPGALRTGMHLRGRSRPGRMPDSGRSAPWGCSLDSDALAARVAQWRAVAAAATSMERTVTTARLTLPADPEMIASVAALCAAETACCPHARFLLDVSAGQVIVTVEAAGTTGLVDMLFPADTSGHR